MLTVMMALCIITLGVALFTFQWGKGLIYIISLASIGYVSMALGFIGYIIVIIMSGFFLKWMWTNK